VESQNIHENIAELQLYTSKLHHCVADIGAEITHTQTMEDESASILHSFSNLITNDKDNLTNQLVQILASKRVDHTTAQFYLDMTNWNVQHAVGAFYDNGCQLITNRNYEFQFIRDVTIGEGESVQPDTRFTKTWLVRNAGQTPWPTSNLCLKYVTGDLLDAKTQHVRVPPLHPGEEHEISVDMKSPSEPGHYGGQWRMYYNGYYFGEPIWVILEVNQSGMLGVMQQMESSISSWTNNNKHPQQQQPQEEREYKNPFQL